jgi:thiosulfate/3-mercaptopyruvate sulfurtransferase
MGHDMNDIFVTPDWLASKLGSPDIGIVDGSWHMPAAGRDGNAEFMAGHIPGAVFFDLEAVSDRRAPYPHMLPSESDFAMAAGALGLDESMTLIIYDAHGLFSAPRVRWTFQVFGAKNVFVLEGGMPRWTALGYPTETGIAKPTRKSFRAVLDRSKVATVDTVRRALADPNGPQIIDARSAARFHGRVPEPRPGVRRGHMPGSFNMPYDLLLDDRGDLRTEADIGNALRQHGIDPAKSAITSCGSGVTAAIVSLALESIGRPATALYDGSWSEWGARTDLPISEQQNS